MAEFAVEVVDGVANRVVRGKNPGGWIETDMHVSPGWPFDEVSKTFSAPAAPPPSTDPKDYPLKR